MPQLATQGMDSEFKSFCIDFLTDRPTGAIPYFPVRYSSRCLHLHYAASAPFLQGGLDDKS
jgi:hypothetical protein